MFNSFKDIVNAARQKGAKKLVIPNPEAADILLLAEATAAGLIVPCLVGNRDAIKTLMAGASLEYELIAVHDPQLALDGALEILRNGAGDVLMPGNVPAQAVLHALHDKSRGMIPKGGLLSFVSVFPLAKKNEIFFVTDTFINNHPTVAEKQQILSNALNLARILGMEEPKVAVLAAIEQVNPGIPSTLAAAVLSKMSERRQFGDAIVEGPLDIDCALSRPAGERKGVKSVVTGDVNIYLVPEIDTGYLMAEVLVYLGKMQMAGALMGTTRPVILDLPFVSGEGRLVQIALACLMKEEGGADG